MQTHREHGRANPAVNVKTYHTPTTTQIEEAFGCTEKQAEQAARYAWESACGQFWQDAQELTRQWFPEGRMACEGRSNGWLVVQGLLPVEEWDAEGVATWNRFETEVLKLRDSLVTWEAWREDIEANKWTLDGAERFNFFDGPNGEAICIAELKAAARAAGFGAVVRD